ncbi:MAG: type III-B CRISPR module RAMP protein Cmr4 [Hyphomicrobiales bacterium]
MSRSAILAMTAETPVHVGIGQAADAIDLPVAREAVTGFPHVPGSGVKGAWRVWYLARDENSVPKMFGTASGDATTDGASGTVLFSEARLAMLPVRCTTDSFKLATCPLTINRLKRDRRRAGWTANWQVPDISTGTYLGEVAPGGSPLGLEEREFRHAREAASDVVEAFQVLMAESAPNDFQSKFVILSDADFKWYCQFGLPIAMRNALNEDKIVKTGALWAEETLAPDTVMWSTLSERTPGAVDAFLERVGAVTHVQMGGNETIGQGWFSVRGLQDG